MLNVYLNRTTICTRQNCQVVLKVIILTEAADSHQTWFPPAKYLQQPTESTHIHPGTKKHSCKWDFEYEQAKFSINKTWKS